MMGRRGRRWWGAVAVLGLAGLPGPARAQVGGAYGPGAAPGYGMSANPYANPYANPFLNPYMTQVPVQGNPALYFLAAQQAKGGIGSGQISGVRPARGASGGATSGTPTTTTTAAGNRRGSDIPGGSAARFFKRSLPATSGANHFYNRQGRYYPANGH